MSATTPGIRQIWMDAVVRCVDQRVSDVADVHGPTVQTSSVNDTADVKSAEQNSALSAGKMTASLQPDQENILVSNNDATTAKCFEKVSDKVDSGMTSVPQLQSSDIYRPPTSSSENALHTDSQPADVCSI